MIFTLEMDFAVFCCMLSYKRLKLMFFFSLINASGTAFFICWVNVDGGKNASSAILIFRLSGIRWDFETGAVYMFRNLFFVQRSLFEFCFYSEKNFKNGLARGAHLPPDDQSKPIKHSNSSTSHKLALANQIPINYHYTSYFISN